MTLAHYQTLDESSVAFGMRKALQAQRDKDSMVSKISELDQECRAFNEEIEKLDSLYDEIVRKDKENEVKEVEEHVELVTSLKNVNINYKNRLWELLYNIRN